MRRYNQFLIVLGLLLIGADVWIWFTASGHGGGGSGGIVLLIVGLVLAFTGVVANLHARVRALEAERREGGRDG